MDGKPDWTNDLEATRRNAFEELERAVHDRDHGFRSGTLSTLGPGGAPRARVLILRETDAAGWSIVFHTDSRSDKVSEIAADPRCSVLFYDAAQKLQIRLEGRADLIALPDERAVAARERAAPMSLECYRVMPGPGSPVGEPGGWTVPEAPAEGEHDPGADVFRQIRVEATAVEILYLARRGHRRSRHTLTADGEIEATWLVP